MNEPPDVIAGAMQESGWPPDQLVDLLRADQRRRWQAGQPLPVASYLRRFPQVLETSTCAVDLIWSEFLIRESLGDRPCLQDYLRNFPQFASLLERQHQVHEWVEQAESASVPVFTTEEASLGGEFKGTIPAAAHGEREPELPSLDDPGFRDPRGARPRRHGGRVPGPRPEPWAGRRLEDDAPPRPCRSVPLQAGVPVAGRHLPSQPRVTPRARLERPRLVLHDGSGRRVRLPVLRPTSGRRGRGAASHRAGRGGTARGRGSGSLERDP